MSDRYRPSDASRRSSRRQTSRRHEASLDSARSSTITTHKDVETDSTSSGGTMPRSRSRSERTSSTRRARRAAGSPPRRHDSGSSRAPSRHHRRKHRHLHHRPSRALVPAPHEEDEEAPDGRMQLAVRGREEWGVQTVPRAHRRSPSLSSDEEEVYDHRPRPVSQRRSPGEPTQRGRQRQQAGGDAEKGFFVAAGLFVMGLVICCSGNEDG